MNSQKGSLARQFLTYFTYQSLALCALQSCGSNSSKIASAGPGAINRGLKNASQSTISNEKKDAILAEVISGGALSEELISLDNGATGFPLMRLTRSQLINSLKDNFNIDISAKISAAFNYVATDTSVDPNGINKEWFDISTQISQAAFAAGSVFENECKNKTDAVCVQDFIKNKGRLLFRHPLNTAEIAQFNTLQAKLTGLEKNEVLSFIFQAMLNSTAFLFVVESPGNATKEPDGSILLDSNSMATRLSLLIHDSSPSEALLQLAEKNMLTTPEQINSATQTLMKDAKFQRQSARFAKSWLKLNKLSEITKTGNAKTLFTANHVSSYTNETELFIGRYFATSGDATQAIPFSQLYNSQSTYINKFNAPIYGLDSNTDQASWQTLPATHNGGILTQPSLLSQLATDEEGSIVRRGVFLIKEILCQPVGAPIKGAEFKPTPAGSAPMSARMQLAEHRKNPACSTCHNRIDNIGFGLEGFDGVGRVATLRPGALKDSVPWGTGFISWNANAGLTSNFSNPSEMGKLIAESNIGKACFVKKWFDSTLGIPMTIPATASLKSLINDFKTNPDGQELILKFTSSDIFRKRIFQ